MVAVAQFLVWEHGLDNLPYLHQRVWTTDGWEYAIVELADWQARTEQEKHVTLQCFKWFVEPRQDIGI